MKRLVYYSVLLPVFFSFFGCALYPKESETSKETVFVSFDTETTGLNAATDRIVEIAAIKFTLTEVIDQKSWLVNPETMIPKRATKIHGISDAMVKDAPPFRDVLKEFKAFAGDTVLIAHNAKFDVRFIVKEAKLCNIPPPENTVVDSLVLFRSWFPESKSHSLGKLSHHLMIRTENMHRALADSEYVRRIITIGIEDDAKRKELSNISKSDHRAIIRFIPDSH